MKLVKVIVLYLIIVFTLLYIKPTLFLDEEGNIKEFGTGETKSVVPLWLVFMCVSILSYFVVFLY